MVLHADNSQGIAVVNDQMTVMEREGEAQFYTVVSGKNLSKIAKKYYSNANKYQAIFGANKLKLKDPNLIYPGQELQIPAIIKDILFRS